MRKQTTTDDNGYQEPEDATIAIANDIGGFSSDVLALLELQGELFRIDARESATRAFVPGILAVLAVGLILGASPLALLGLAWGLSTWTNLSQSASALIVAGLGLVLALGIAWLAFKGFRYAVSAWKTSTAECRRNIDWLKGTLKGKRRTSGPPHRRPR